MVSILLQTNFQHKKEVIILFTMRYQLVLDRYLQTKRVKLNVLLGNFTIQDGRMQKNSTVEEIPPATYSQRKIEVS